MWESKSDLFVYYVYGSAQSSGQKCKVHRHLWRRRKVTQCRIYLVANNTSAKRGELCVTSKNEYFWQKKVLLSFIFDNRLSFVFYNIITWVYLWERERTDWPIRLCIYYIIAKDKRKTFLIPHTLFKLVLLAGFLSHSSIIIVTQAEQTSL